MSSTLKECKKCHNFYDIQNINFCLNVAISEKLHENPKNNHFLKLNNLMEESTGIKWCTCFSEEKIEKISEAEKFLEKVKKEEEQSLGFDFKLNEDIVYVTNNNNYSSILLLKFVKSLKSRLKENELLSFDYLDFDKMTNKDFSSKHYYSNPKYLLIFDFENLQEDNIKIIIGINNIIKQRKSNNKKTFIISKNDFKDLEKSLITRFYTKDEYIILEFINLMKNEFKHRRITTIEKKENVKITTTAIRNTKPKKINQAKQETQALEL